MKPSARSKAAKKAAKTRAINAASWRHYRENVAPGITRVNSLLNWWLKKHGTLSVKLSEEGERNLRRLKGGAVYGEIVRFDDGGRYLKVTPEGYKRPLNLPTAYWEFLL